MPFSERVTRIPISADMLSFKQNLSTLVEQDRVSEALSAFGPIITAHTALAASRKITALHSSYLGVKPPHAVTDSWKPAIDAVAAGKMAKMFDLVMPVGMSLETVGSEGSGGAQAKDAAEYKKYGSDRVASCEGVFGYGKKVGVNAIIDVVDGTRPASRNESGATSVLAMARRLPGSDYGMRPVQPGQNYSMKVVGPPQIKGFVDLRQSPKDFILGCCDGLKIAPKELTLVTMETNSSKPHRTVNGGYIEAATELGVKLVTIDVGDVVPGILASLDPIRYGLEPSVFVGSGGSEETGTILTAVAADGGFGQVRDYDSVIGQYKDRIFEVGDMVPGESPVVNVSFITPDLWLGQSGVTQERQDFFVIRTLMINSDGPHILEHQFNVE